MPLLTCPTPEVLKQFLLGMLPLEKSGELEEHFATCSDCATNARKLTEVNLANADTPFANNSDSDAWCQALAIPLDLASELDAQGSASTWIGDTPLTSRDKKVESTRQASIHTGTVIRGYEIQNVLGKGGMGIVYRATQIALKRQVALKMILGGALVGEERLARFRQEAELLARVRHPHIIQIFEIGEYEGVLFFSMEFAEGGTLADLIKRRGLPIRRSAEIVESISRGVHAAHELGIVHRDLKPANILLTSDQVPKVTDFGLAKQMGDSSSPTLTGDIIGSPTYMSPEQAAGRHEEIGRTTDVYGMGVLLYELTTGTPPFLGNVEKILRQVMRNEPSNPRTIVPSLPADLETIILKCMQKEPKRRFQTAAELGDELARWLRGEPILSRPVGRVERLTRWSRRNPLTAALILLSALFLLVGSCVSTVFAISASRNAAEANQNAQLAAQKEQLAQENALAANDQAEKAQQQKDRADKQANLAKKQEELARNRERDARWNAYVLGMNNAFAAWESAATERAHEVLDQFIPKSGEPDLRGPEWYLLWSQLHGDEFTLRGHRRTVNSVDWSPDGRTIASASDDHTVILWDVERRSISRKITDHTDSVRKVVFSPRGDFLATAASDGTIRIYDARTWEPRKVLPLGYIKGINLAVSPDGRFLAAVTDVGNGGDPSLAEASTVGLSIWKTDDWQIWSWTQGVRGYLVTFSPDSQIVVASDSREVFLQDVATRQELARFSGCHRAAHFTADASRLILNDDCTQNQRKLVIWNRHTGESASAGWKERSFTWHLAMSPDRNVVALSEGASGAYGALELWDIREERELGTLEGHRGTVLASAFSPDGRRLVSCGTDDTVRVWNVANRINQSEPAGHTAAVTRAVKSPDGRWIATTGKDRRLILWDRKSGKRMHVLRTEKLIADLAFSPDSRQLAYAIPELGVDGLSFLNMETRQSHQVPLSTGAVTSVTWLKDGTQVAAGGGAATGTVQFVDPVAGQLRDMLESSGGGVTTFQLSPDESLVATANRDNSICLIDRATRQVKHRLQGHTDTIHCLAFSPDGKSLASGSRDGTIHTWNVPNGLSRGGFPVLYTRKDVEVYLISYVSNADMIVGMRYGDHGFIGTVDGKSRSPTFRNTTENRPSQISMTPDGKTLLIGQADGRTSEWDLNSMSEVLWLGDRNVCTAVTISSDDRRVAVARSRRIEIVDLKSGTVHSGDDRESLRSTIGPYASLAFSPNGRWLVGATMVPKSKATKGRTDVWDALTGDSMASLETAGRCMNFAFSNDGQQLATVSHPPQSRQGPLSIEFWKVPGWQNSNRSINESIGTDDIGSIHFLQNGEQLIVGTKPKWNQDPGELMLWNTTSAERLYRFEAHSGAVHAALALPGDQLLTAGEDLLLKLWDVQSGKTLRKVRVDSIPHALTLLRGNRIAVGGIDGRIHLLEYDTWQELGSWKADWKSVAGLAASRDGSLLASISDQESDYTEPYHAWKSAAPAEVHNAIEIERAILDDDMLRKKAFADQITAQTEKVKAAHTEGQLDLKTYHFALQVLRIEELDRDAYDKDCLDLIRSCCDGKLPWPQLKGHVADLIPSTNRKSKTLMELYLQRLAAWSETVNRARARADAALAKKQRPELEDAYEHLWRNDSGSRNNPQMQEQLASVSKRKVLVDSVGIELVELYPGRFVMGSPSSEEGHQLSEMRHAVQLTGTRFLSSKEVTRKQFGDFVTQTRYVTDAEKTAVKQPGSSSTWKQPGFEQTDDHPVVNVSWNDAVAFCQWLSKKEGKAYRLPTESEFEFACRAGKLQPFPTGEALTTIESHANVADLSSEPILHKASKFPFRDGSPNTSPVARYKGNAWRIFDLVGNVREWCLDRSGNYPTLLAIDPTGSTAGVNRMIRGGSWRSSPDACRAAAREQADPASSADDLGFRVVRESE